MGQFGVWGCRRGWACHRHCSPVPTALSLQGAHRDGTGPGSLDAGTWYGSGWWNDKAWLEAMMVSRGQQVLFVSGLDPDVTNTDVHVGSKGRALKPSPWTLGLLNIPEIHLGVGDGRTHE